MHPHRELACTRAHTTLACGRNSLRRAARGCPRRQQAATSFGGPANPHPAAQTPPATPPCVGRHAPLARAKNRQASYLAHTDSATRDSAARCRQHPAQHHTLLRPRQQPRAYATTQHSATCCLAQQALNLRAPAWHGTHTTHHSGSTPCARTLSQTPAHAAHVCAQGLAPQRAHTIDTASQHVTRCSRAHEWPRTRMHASIHPSAGERCSRASVAARIHPSIHPAAAPQAEHQLPRTSIPPSSCCTTSRASVAAHVLIECARERLAEAARHAASTRQAPALCCVC